MILFGCATKPFMACLLSVIANTFYDLSSTPSSISAIQHLDPHSWIIRRTLLQIEVRHNWAFRLISVTTTTYDRD
jgi:hypothetical protein